jgi:ribosomal protein S17
VIHFGETPVKWSFAFLIVGFAAVVLITGCKNEIPKNTEKPEGHPAVATNPHPQTGGFSGKVVETMNASRYTYVQVDTGEKKNWVAAPQLQVKIGDSVNVPEGQPLFNFHSSILNRDFDVIYFVPRVMVAGKRERISGDTNVPPGHPMIVNSKNVQVDLSGIDKVEGGQTIAEIYSDKEKFAGKQIKVRGKVVKFNAQIMEKNWMHIRDGSTSDGDNDLTVTTNVVARVGDTIVVSGTLAISKDFGYGIKSDAIIENARVIVENNPSE